MVIDSIHISAGKIQYIYKSNSNGPMNQIPNLHLSISVYNVLDTRF